MPTIFSHAIFATVIGKSSVSKTISVWFWLITAACAMIPDADVISIRFGVERGSMFSHRGFTHSIFFAILFGSFAAFIAHKFLRTGISFVKLAVFFSLATFSHPLLDMLTNGGSGVALFAPFSGERFAFSVATDRSFADRFEIFRRTRFGRNFERNNLGLVSGNFDLRFGVFNQEIAKIIFMLIHMAEIKGSEVDEQTRCAHYHKSFDIIAIKFKCCGDWFPCFECHAENADHVPTVWALNEFDIKAVLCGNCGVQLTVSEYLKCDSACPNCESLFNPGCANHYHLYFGSRD